MVIGLTMLMIGQGLRILAIGLSYIVRGGRMRRIYAENLVTDGLFSHCRNPLYVGNILIVMGFVFVSGNLTGIIVGSLAFIAIYRLIVHSEEEFFKRKVWRSCIQLSVPMSLAGYPGWKGCRETIQNYQFDWPKVAVKEYGTIMTSLMIPLGLMAYKLNLANKLGEYQSIINCLGSACIGCLWICPFFKEN